MARDARETATTLCDLLEICDLYRGLADRDPEAVQLIEALSDGLIEETAGASPDALRRALEFIGALRDVPTLSMDRDELDDASDAIETEIGARHAAARIAQSESR